MGTDINIHFHSDCPFFGGCENMLANFFNSSEFRNLYNISFSYRKTAAYEKGLNSRLKKELDAMPLPLVDYWSFRNRIRKIFFRPISGFLEILFLVFLVRYVFFAFNATVLVFALSKKKIDLLFINAGGYPAAYSCLAAVLSGRLVGVKKIIYVVNNVAVGYSKPSRWWDYPLDRMVAKNVDLFITGSKYAGEKLMSVLNLSPNKWANIPNGINPRFVTESRTEFFNRLGIDSSRLIFSSISVLEKRKGHIYFLKAVKLLLESGFKNLPVVVIEGSGPLLNELKEYADLSGISDFVRFIGCEKEIFNLINYSDALLLMSTQDEDFPNIVLEGMSAGKPVIASRFAGISEQIEHMISGVLVEPGNIEEIAQYILMLSENEKLRFKLGESARKRFKENFTSEIALKRYILKINKLIGE